MLVERRAVPRQYHPLADRLERQFLSDQRVDDAIDGVEHLVLDLAAQD